MLGLVVLYVFVAFVYGRGWSDLLNALIGLVLVFVGIACLALLARWWARGWSRP